MGGLVYTHFFFKHNEFTIVVLGAGCGVAKSNRFFRSRWLPWKWKRCRRKRKSKQSQGGEQGGEQPGWAKSDHNSGGRGQAVLVPCIRNMEHTRVCRRGLHDNYDDVPTFSMVSSWSFLTRFFSLISFSWTFVGQRRIVWYYSGVDGGSRATPTHNLFSYVHSRAKFPSA